MNDKEIGEKICNLRNSLSLNQIDFGKAVGLRQGTVSTVEIGKKRLTVSELVTISQTFGVSVDEILFGAPVNSGGIEAAALRARLQEIAEIASRA